MDPFQLLMQQHREVEALFKAFEGSQDPSQKRMLFEKIRDRFETHSDLEEKYLYPLLVQHSKTEDLTNEAYEEHHGVDLFLNEAESLEPEDAAFEAKMTVVKEYIEHHVQEEEQELFQTAQQTLTEDEKRAFADGLRAGITHPTGT